MNIYYTTSQGTDTIQVKHELSLGGYKSSTQVQNDVFGNIIQEASIRSLEKQTPYYIGLIMKNETGLSLTDVLFWFEYPADGLVKLEIAATDLSSTGAIERIPTQYSKPIYATFYEANGEENSVSLGNLSIDEEIGIWLKISYVASQITYNKLNSTIIAKGVNNPDEIKSISIKVDWTEPLYGGGLGENNL
jgi:hypothetical protein